MKILLTDSAFSDLKDLKEYYKELGVPDIGLRFVSDIFTHIKVLSDHPKIGRKVPEFDDGCIREIIHPPFRVVYWLRPKKIHIIRVWRSERLLKLPTEDI